RLHICTHVRNMDTVGRWRMCKEDATRETPVILMIFRHARTAGDGSRRISPPSSAGELISATAPPKEAACRTSPASASLVLIAPTHVPMPSPRLGRAPVYAAVQARFPPESLGRTHACRGTSVHCRAAHVCDRVRVGARGGGGRPPGPFSRSGRDWGRRFPHLPQSKGATGSGRKRYCRAPRRCHARAQEP